MGRVAAVESFARSLRFHCLRKGTIAQLCKGTGINRQQFNKYLAGQMLPGARTMRKICGYLGVSEEQLMSAQPSEIENSFGGGTAIQDELRLNNGLYRAYFPVPGHCELVARWLVHVRPAAGGSQVHSCRNHFRDPASLGFGAARIRYRGPVTYRPEEASLIGLAQRPQPLQGVISVDLRPSWGTDYFPALVLTRRATGPIALSGALNYLGPECTPRQALAGMGVVPICDPSLDPVIVQMLRGVPVGGANWLQSINEKNLHTMRGGSPLPEAVAVSDLTA